MSSRIEIFEWDFLLVEVEVRFVYYFVVELQEMFAEVDVVNFFRVEILRGRVFRRFDHISDIIDIRVVEPAQIIRYSTNHVYVEV